MSKILSFSLSLFRSVAFFSSRQQQNNLIKTIFPYLCSNHGGVAVVFVFFFSFFF